MAAVSCLWAAAEAAEDGLRFDADAGQGGLVVVANRDDDDADGRPDADDERVNGPTDLDDLRPLVVTAVDGRITAVRCGSDAAEIRLFTRHGAGWRPLAGDALPLVAGRAELRVECRSWAGMPPGWDGRGTITAVGFDAEGNELARAEIACAVVPVTLVPETAVAREVYVARGRYDNEAFLTDLRRVLDGLRLPLVVHDATAWQEMWMQDTMEFATTAVPGEPATAMSVVLAGVRGCDPFPATLLGPGTAVARIAEPRSLGGGDAWADWFGNLTVSPPTPAHPAGRIIYGRNVRSGESLHPDVVRFLAAQRRQPPVWIDTSWLVIKHVDEIVAFLPGRDGRGALLVPDPLAGVELARAAGLAAAVGPNADAFAEANRRIAAGIEAMLAGTGDPPRAGPADAAAPPDGLLALLGWQAERVVRLPVAFVPPAGPVPADGVAEAEALWSNPVNMLFANGTVICGKAGMPEPVARACQERFLAAGAGAVVLLDDGCYHRAKGNIHCGTNARRDLQVSELHRRTAEPELD